MPVPHLPRRFGKRKHRLLLGSRRPAERRPQALTHSCHRASASPPPGTGLWRLQGPDGGSSRKGWLPLGRLALRSGGIDLVRSRGTALPDPPAVVVWSHRSRGGPGWRALRTARRRYQLGAGWADPRWRGGSVPRNGVRHLEQERGPALHAPIPSVKPDVHGKISKATASLDGLNVTLGDVRSRGALVD
jgi:hypothetical protein